MTPNIYDQIKRLAQTYSSKLHEQVESRVQEMKGDDKSHYLIYRVLGVSNQEGELVDLYQNKGRFLYKYAGAFLEEATKICVLNKYPDAQAVRIPNKSGNRPKTFEIDCLVGSLAHEIKWRDATTDGDHIAKEHARVQAISQHGYTPVRIMFYYPQRRQAQAIQETLKTLYAGVGGQYYFGDAAWQYVRELSGTDLLAILEKISAERAQ